MEYQKSFVIDTLSALSVVNVDMLSRITANMFFGIVQGITTIFSELYANNDLAEEQMSVTLPHQLCKIRPCRLSQPISLNKELPEHEGWSAEAIKSIEHDHREMVLTYRD